MTAERMDSRSAFQWRSRPPLASDEPQTEEKRRRSDRFQPEREGREQSLMAAKIPACDSILITS